MVVRLAVEGDEALISIGDNGVGIAPETRDRIFDPYFTTRPDGAGLGLAVARELVAAAGGSIEVASTPGVGSTFTVRLPRVTS